MSGVYIRGIDTPKNCWACTFFDSDGFCVIDGLSRDAEEKTDCPLIPVPDHGELIDRDKAVQDLRMDYAYAAAKIVALQPTIIPADKEGEA